jgi:hypothetical protein
VGRKLFSTTPYAFGGRRIMWIEYIQLVILFSILYLIIWKLDTTPVILPRKTIEEEEE